MEAESEAGALSIADKQSLLDSFNRMKSLLGPG
jgi:hypothetical protein